ncbi:MAG: aspartate/glutamate racemase family protein [Dehalococcoidia bacterium]
MAYGYIGRSDQSHVKLSIAYGQAIAGVAIGILVLDLCYPYLPGNVANASTFGFPVRYKILKGMGANILKADPSILDAAVEAGKELQQQGVRAIVGACGFFANYQKEVSARLDVPVFLSSLLQIPIIKLSLKPGKRVGILTAVAPSLTPDLLSQCGVTTLSDIVIAGAQDLSEFQNILECSGSFNSQKIEEELVGLATKLIQQIFQIEAIFA